MAEDAETSQCLKMMTLRTLEGCRHEATGESENPWTEISARRTRGAGGGLPQIQDQVVPEAASTLFFRNKAVTRYAGSVRVSFPPRVRGTHPWCYSGITSGFNPNTHSGGVACL